MVRYDPPAYVLIDMGGTAGECIYPLALGFGAPGRGENLHRPPHEHASRPGDTASGLPRPPTIPRHGRHKLAQWVSMANVAQPPWPTSVFPGGSWQESALNPTQAGLWDRDGNINMATTAFPADQQGNDDGNFVLSSEGSRNRTPEAGSNQRPMAYARFYLSCHLRTTGSHIRPKNGYLTKEEVDLSTPPPPPPPDVAEDANVASTAATSSTIAPAPTKKTAHVRTRRLRNHIPALRHPLGGPNGLGALVCIGNRQGTQSTLTASGTASPTS